MLPADILARHAGEAARYIALDLLAQARAAAGRLGDDDDAEALHDFRVAIRRLRSTSRAWRAELEPSLRPRHRRALRALQAATGDGRDGEVALAWLAAQRSELRPAQRHGHDWLVERLERKREGSLVRVRDETSHAFERIDRELAQRLERMTIEIRAAVTGRAISFGAALASRAREQADELVEILGEVSSADDEERCHASRIACKRLRYLVEPLQPQLEAAGCVVARCKRLQDLLGELDEGPVRLRELAEAFAEATVEETQRLFELVRPRATGRPARPAGRSARPGLFELIRRVQRRVRLHFEDLEKHWLGGE